MRAYFWGNYYLSSLQQGVQATHVLGEMFVKYTKNSAPKDNLHDWAKNQKTVILLNGGNSDSIKERCKVLEEIAPTLRLPFASFCEDKASLNSALTCAGVVLSEDFYGPTWTRERVRALRMKVEVEGFEDSLSAAASHAFSATERMRLLMDCRLAI